MKAPSKLQERSLKYPPFIYSLTLKRIWDQRQFRNKLLRLFLFSLFLLPPLLKQASCSKPFRLTCISLRTENIQSKQLDFSSYLRDFRVWGETPFITTQWDVSVAHSRLTSTLTHTQTQMSKDKYTLSPECAWNPPSNRKLEVAGQWRREHDTVLNEMEKRRGFLTHTHTHSHTFGN